MVKNLKFQSSTVFFSQNSFLVFMPHHSKILTHLQFKGFLIEKVKLQNQFFCLSLQYICENHFQRLSKTSMFTGLKAVNHFGRPDMSSFLKFVQKKHSYVSVKWGLPRLPEQCCNVFLCNLQVSKIGVFSCGPRPLTKSVMSACDEVNKGRKLPYFIHHFENFGQLFCIKLGIIYMITVILINVCL